MNLFFKRFRNNRLNKKKQESMARGIPMDILESQKERQFHKLVIGPSSSGKTGYKVPERAVLSARNTGANATYTGDRTNPLHPFNPINTFVSDDDLVKTGGCASNEIEGSGSDSGSCSD
ncbi:hypothetical protein SIM22_04240 [Bacillus cereus group sp. BfR-BA-01363]|uniref:hypothetical protein n=1 Tax=Bacillus cereus group sp. BfR-BA-01363 TaxID=3094882 RepID=UPI0029C208B1|nr:hypothetical protein [Bacillus cereus group sp. BfR-BA-01363]MDX5853338.1 hypothetical protein [Bacillus cereus group sp. BfR-BA-01363]